MASRPPFGAIFGRIEPFWPFWPFLTPFGYLGVGQRLQMGPDSLKLGNVPGSQNWWVPRAQVASRPPFGAIFGQFEPFGALLGLFLTPFGHLGGGQRLKVDSDPL